MALLKRQDEIIVYLYTQKNGIQEMSLPICFMLVCGRSAMISASSIWKKAIVLYPIK